jgi:hypothetical protein
MLSIARSPSVTQATPVEVPEWANGRQQKYLDLRVARAAHPSSNLAISAAPFTILDRFVKVFTRLRHAVDKLGWLS